MRQTMQGQTAAGRTARRSAPPVVAPRPRALGVRPTMNLRPNAPSSPQGELPIPSAPQQREADVSTSDAIAKTKSTAAAARATTAKPKAATGQSRKMSSLRPTDQEGDQPPDRKSVV